MSRDRDHALGDDSPMRGDPVRCILPATPPTAKFASLAEWLVRRALGVPSRQKQSRAAIIRVWGYWANRARGGRVMARWVAIAGLMLGLAGCGEAHRTRVVPVTPTSASGGDEAAERAVTKPPRAIATH